MIGQTEEEFARTLNEKNGSPQAVWSVEMEAYCADEPAIVQVMGVVAVGADQDPGLQYYMKEALNDQQNLSEQHKSKNTVYTM